MNNSDLLSPLRDTLKGLVKARDEIDRKIAILERTLNDLDGKPSLSSPSYVTTANNYFTEARTVREIVADLGATKPVFTLDEVVAAAAKEGNNAKAESISSILSRLKREGIIVPGARRGTYRLNKSEAPALAGASAAEPSAAVDAAVPAQEGEQHGDRGDHRDPAPVMGAS